MQYFWISSYLMARRHSGRKKSSFLVILLVHMIRNRWQQLNEPLFPRVTLCLQIETRKNLETPITFVLHGTCAPLHWHLSFSLRIEAKKALDTLKWYLVIVKRGTEVHQMPSSIFNGSRHLVIVLQPPSAP